MCHTQDNNSSFVIFSNDDIACLKNELDDGVLIETDCRDFLDFDTAVSPPPPQSQANKT